jgi:hypothetical protein
MRIVISSFRVQDVVPGEDALLRDVAIRPTIKTPIAQVPPGVMG